VFASRSMGITKKRALLADISLAEAEDPDRVADPPVKVHYPQHRLLKPTPDELFSCPTEAAPFLAPGGPPRRWHLR
jgi:hypothetical protein